MNGSTGAQGSAGAQGAAGSQGAQGASGSPLPRVVAIGFASTVTPNADTTDVLNIGTLTGALTLAAPTTSTSVADGQNLRIRFVQDATGRAISFNAAYAFGTDITLAQVPVSTPSAKFEMLFTWNATDSKWRVSALVRGF